MSETTTHAHLASGQGSSWWFGTDLHTFKALSETTNGAYTLTELTARPEFEPPPHIHHREDEAFYVLEGQFEFWYNDRTFTAGAGSFVYLAKGPAHKHGATGAAPARAWCSTPRPGWSVLSRRPASRRPISP